MDAIATNKDPIFTLIQQHRAAWQRAEEASDATGDELTKLVDVHAEPYSLLEGTTPTTMPGHVAKWRYVLIETIQNGMEEPNWSDNVHMLQGMFDELEKLSDAD